MASSNPSRIHTNSGTHEHVMGSERRYLLLGGPGGYLTVVRAGSQLHAYRYARWQVLAKINAPRNRWHAPMAVADQAKTWALGNFEVV